MSRLSLEAFLVLHRLRPDVATYGASLVAVLSLRRTSVHRMLVQLQRDGYAVGAKEELDPRVVGRPLRMYYRRTPAGTAEVERVLTLLRPRPDFAALAARAAARPPEVAALRQGRLDSWEVGVAAMALGEEHLAAGNLAAARRWFEMAATHEAVGAKDQLAVVAMAEAGSDRP